MATSTVDAAASTPRRRFGTGAIALASAAVVLLLLGWNFLADPSLSAPTRDPAWYTWRAQVILDADPGSVAGEWGPFVGADPAEGKEGTALLSGGYRVTTPLAGALLQRVAGIDTYSFSAFLMLGIPVLTGLAFAAGAYRSRKHWLVIPMSILAAAALFMTTPYVGYLDNITVLFLLALTFPFLGPARTHWGSRIALITDRGRGRLHPSHDVRPVRAHDAGRLRVPRPDVAPAPRARAEVRRSRGDVRGVRHGRRARLLGPRDLGDGREPQRRRAAAAVHEGVLRRTVG